MPARNKALSCAVCVVGQLARLELESKARHSRKLFPEPNSLYLRHPSHDESQIHPPSSCPNSIQVRHVVEPNLLAGHTIALLMVLSQVRLALHYRCVSSVTLTLSCAN